MITKALPIPEVTPFSYISRAIRPISPFYFREGNGPGAYLSIRSRQLPAAGCASIQLSTLWLCSPGTARQVETERNKKIPWNGRMPGSCSAWHLLWKSLFKNSNCLLGAAFICFILWSYYMKEKWMDYDNPFNVFWKKYEQNMNAEKRRREVQNGNFVKKLRKLWRNKKYF